MKLTLLLLKVILMLSLGGLAPIQASGSRIIATGGATQLEGAAGGGLVPWAVINGYAQEYEKSFSVFNSRLSTDDFDFEMSGFSAGFDNRYEFSYAKQQFSIDSLQASLNLPSNVLKQQILGGKVKLYGDLIYTQLPQISVGFQYKKLDQFLVPRIAGAFKSKGIDYYLSASKLYLNGVKGFPLLFNMTLRSSQANQLGLLGFSGDLNSSRKLLWEFNTSLFMARNWVIGYEFRQKPDNLSFAKEEHWRDIYLAWFYNKNISGVLSWVDLGSVAGLNKQSGIYLSMQATF